MKVKISILLFILAICFCGNIFSQTIKIFSPDPVKFVDEMQQFLGETNRKDGDKLIEIFKPAWNSGKFTQQQQTDIYRTANAMLKKRMKAFPDFSNYLSALINFSQSNQSSASFAAWQESLDKLLTGAIRHFSNYIITCNNLFRDNTLYQSSSTEWHSDNSNYSFDFDSVPKIIFPSLTLTCSARGDSSLIANTKGFLYPTKQLFYGQGGTVNWIRAGVDPSIASAELRDYIVDVTGIEFLADSVIFHNTAYFKKPLVGRYTDKILANINAESASYPKFASYTTGLEIKNIVPDIDYRGGFSMEGSKIVGSGNATENAELIFYRDKKPFLLSESKSFAIRKDKLTADIASVTFFLGKDSIYHPGVTFKYNVKDRELSLIRGEEGKSKSPYFDSFHQVDMYFDGLYWKIDEPIINMKMISGTGESKATFESGNFFRKLRFLRLQGLSTTHPLFTIKQFVEKNGGNKTIYTEDLAKYMKLPPSEVRTMLIRLSNEGFIAYDGTEDKSLVKDRLYYYLLANIGKTDYDVIQFESIIESKPNASINLLNYEITMRGLAPIILSDSQNVVIYPQDQEIKLNKDRDFSFAGKVHAGRFDFYGKQFSFDYQNFKVNLNNVDSLLIKVESDDPAEQDEYGRRKLVYIRSVLENITGDLLIDFQGNKSGMHEYPNYPIFNSKKDSYVNYDKPYIQQGVYTRDKFFFHLDPFTIDSLDNFTKEGLRFNGEFISAGIFPDFRDTLRLQPDLSLGLVRSTGTEGWQAYGGKGKFTNKVHLSNEGLHGDGSLDYLTSTSKSDDYLFLPDSMEAITKSFTNKKTTLAEVEFPAVKADTVALKWFPANDYMNINKVNTNLRMYDTLAYLDGNLQLKPKGMTGGGIMHLQSSELEAQLFKFKKDVFDSDTSDFRLASDNTLALALTTKNVNSHIDFINRLGEFKSNGGGSYVSFPLNEYICYIDRFKWFMDIKEVELSAGNQTVAGDTSGTGVSLNGSDFISVEPRQDSLRWKAPFARYSLKDYLIKADKVALIQTADASVIPDSGKVIVERYAKMHTLKNARIIANNTTKYHTIYNAEVNILGRKKYEGMGDYDYVDEKKVKHHLHFDKIAVDTLAQTFADGELSDSSGFPLSPQFLFKGNVHLTAVQEFLRFTGYTKPNFHCNKVQQNWIKFSGDINPVFVNIPISSPITDDGVKLAAAVAQTADSTGIYAAFLMPKQRPTDLEIINAEGLLYYEKNTNKFCITTKEKLEKPGIAGNYLSLNDNLCTVYGEGKLNFGCDLGQVELSTVGNVTNNLNNDSTNLDLLAAVDFFFNDDALKVMSTQLTTNAALQPTREAGQATYERGLAELVGKEKADKLIAEINLYGSFKKMPDELRHTFFFTELKLVWNNSTKSYRSVGSIGLGSIDKTSVNREMKGYIEIVHKRSGDAINIYLEPEAGQYFYFSYTRGLMQVLSSYSAFNDEINKMKPDKRVKKVKEKPDFEYVLSTDRAVKNFVRKMQPQNDEDSR
jgi:hypothetical protein